ncbi:MAG: helix-turn-helix domain-containing protein [Planctomycetota bacterium]
MSKLLSTSEFAEAIGVSESSIRRLADSGDISIHRTKGGHRKIPVEEAIRYVRQNGIQPAQPALLGVSLTEEADLPDNFFEALVDGDSDRAVQILQTLYIRGSNASSIFDGPVHEAMVKIGEKFPDDRRSIFVEHRATIICLRSLMQLRSIMPSLKQSSKKSICAAPPGDPYLLPSLMCSIVLYEIGFVEGNLGPNTPLDIVIDAVEDESPSLICLSITSAIRSKSQILELEKLNSAALERGCRLVIGGQNSDLVDLPQIQRIRSLKDLEEIGTSIIKYQ